MTDNKPRIIWLNVIIFVSTFLVAAIGVPYRAFTHGFTGLELFAALICFIFCGISITAGYHRLWSHKTYSGHWSVRLLFAIGGAFALQNSILHWASDHRVHHKHVDNNDKDPYSAKKGFWYSHIGWMCREYTASSYSDYSNARDLQKDKIVMWQHNNYILLAALTNFGIPILFGLATGDVINSLLLLGFLRLVLSHHTTFFINSLAHIWGKQTYTDKNTARDNGVLAFFTFGEGYHNFHHIFENDYRNGIRWWHFDPTKWLIKSFAFLGLATKLRVTPEDKIRKAKLAMILKRSKSRVAKKALPNADQIIENLQHDYEQLLLKMNEFYEAKKQVITLKKEQLLADVEHSELMHQYQELKQHLKMMQKHWIRQAQAAYAG
ncbi:acyl-CoA desaturase [Thalassotalea agarivorans]|uniref:Delta-9 acyl-phospholipid desaturase n=1 Tax=Thalassotalea agarivorans TaxID=349064 RepID=A0A1I0GPF8_THASX|nr:fatty acid desaturase [Thalassotalea agarivorans]SET72936.1 Delta-9 acyl-phospholipid desaturase [Thalassotalea agarivorans]